MDPTTTTSQGYSGWIGREAYDVTGERVGRIENIFSDERTGKPEWLAISTGLFGVKTSLAPIAGSTTFNDGLQLSVTKDQIKDAPRVDANTPLTESEEQMLYSHYGISWEDTTYFESENRADLGYAVEAPPVTEPTTMGPPTGDVVDEVEVRSEDAEVVKTERVGKVRLRKYQWTEMVEVPVTKEAIAVETDPDVEVRDTDPTVTRTT